MGGGRSSVQSVRSLLSSIARGTPSGHAVTSCSNAPVGPGWTAVAGPVILILPATSTWRTRKAAWPGVDLFHQVIMRPWILVYDGECQFCRRQVALVERWDDDRRIEPIPFQQADLARLGVRRAAAEEAMHLVAPSGAVWRGAAAARELLRLLPRLRWLAWIFRLPGAMTVAEFAYSWVAKRRHRFGCASATCQRGASAD